MRMRGPAARTLPTSSMMPVNNCRPLLFHDVSLNGKFVGRNGMEPHAMHLNGVGSAQKSASSGHGKRLQAAQDFRGVIEEDFVDDTGLQRRPIQLTSRFDHQR